MRHKINIGWGCIAESVGGTAWWRGGIGKGLYVCVCVRNFRYSMIQNGTVWYSMVQNGTVIQNGTVWYRMVQYDTV